MNLKTKKRIKACYESEKLMGIWTKIIIKFILDGNEKRKRNK